MVSDSFVDRRGSTRRPRSWTGGRTSRTSLPHRSMQRSSETSSGRTYRRCELSLLLSLAPPFLLLPPSLLLLLSSPLPHTPPTHTHHARTHPPPLTRRLSLTAFAAGATKCANPTGSVTVTPSILPKVTLSLALAPPLPPSLSLRVCVCVCVCVCVSC